MGDLEARSSFLFGVDQILHELEGRAGLSFTDLFDATAHFFLPSLQHSEVGGLLIVLMWLSMVGASCLAADIFDYWFLVPTVSLMPLSTFVWNNFLRRWEADNCPLDAFSPQAIFTSCQTRVLLPQDDSIVDPIVNVSAAGGGGDGGGGGGVGVGVGGGMGGVGNTAIDAEAALSGSTARASESTSVRNPATLGTSGSCSPKCECSRECITSLSQSWSFGFGLIVSAVLLSLPAKHWYVSLYIALISCSVFLALLSVTRWKVFVKIDMELGIYACMSWLPLAAFGASAGTAFGANNVAVFTIVLTSVSSQLFILSYAIYRDCQQMSQSPDLEKLKYWVRGIATGSFASMLVFVIVLAALYSAALGVGLTALLGS